MLFFFLVMSDLCVVFPSREGIKGCVMVRGAGCDEMIFEVVSVDFGWLLLILVAVRGRHTPPAPLERGGLNTAFLFDI